MGKQRHTERASTIATAVRTGGDPRKVPNSPKSLKPGDYIYFNQYRYLFKGYNPDDHQLLTVQDIETKEETELQYLELVMPASEDDAPVYGRTLEELNTRVQRIFAPPSGLPDVQYPNDAKSRAFEKLRNDARTRKAIVEAVDEAVAEREAVAKLLEEPFNSTEAIIEACSQLHRVGLKAGKSNYYKFKSFGTEHGWDIDRMASAMHRSTYNQTRMSLAQLHFLDSLIMRYYRKPSNTGWALYYELAPLLLARTGGRWVDPEKCSGKVTEELEGRLFNPKVPFQSIVEHPEQGPLLTEAGKPVTMPSKSWFYQYLRWFTHLPDRGRSVIVARYDVETWERNHLIFECFTTRAQFARQYTFSDHCLLDVWGLDGQGKLTRWWLTVIVCAYSRSIMGFALLEEAPSSESVLTALRSCIYPKNALLAQMGIDGDWDAHGIPMKLFLDNAWAHHSITLEDFANLISCKGQFDSIKLDFRAPYKARYGSIVEALFGNFSKLVQTLPGGIKKRDPKSLRSAREDAMLLYDNMLRIIVQLIVRYQNTPHRSLEGKTPNQKWLEGTRSHRLLVPPLTPAIERLFLRKFNGTRQYREHGFSAFGMHYTVNGGKSIPQRAKNSQYIDYELRYSANDISRMSVFLGETFIEDVYAKELRRADNISHIRCSLAERELAMQLAAEMNSDAPWYVWFSQLPETKKKRHAERREQHLTQKALVSGSIEVQASPAAPAKARNGARDGASGKAPSGADRANNSLNTEDLFTELLSGWGGPGTL